MRILNLGELGARALIFGAPGSNLQAVMALLGQAARLRLPKRAVICTGDLTGPCGDPGAVVSVLRGSGCPILAGDRERRLGRPAADAGLAESAAEPPLAGWERLARDRLPEADRAWMGHLPDAILFDLRGRRHIVIHGGLADPARRLWPTDGEEGFREEIAAIARRLPGVEIDTVVAGHSGLAFHRRIDGTGWINAGSIGFPENDGRPATRFVTLGPDGPRLHRLSYDVAGAQARMRALGLDPAAIDALASGYWPQQQSLPPALRRKRG